MSINHYSKITVLLVVDVFLRELELRSYKSSSEIEHIQFAAALNAVRKLRTLIDRSLT